MVVRAWLYLHIPLWLLLSGLSLFAPQIAAQRLHLIPDALAGTSEIRGLFGGGFLAFGVIILAGLRIKPLAKGMLGAIGLIMAGVVIGRIVSLIVDHDLFALRIGSTESLVALACWYEFRQKADPV